MAVPDVVFPEVVVGLLEFTFQHPDADDVDIPFGQFFQSRLYVPAVLRDRFDVQVLVVGQQRPGRDDAVDLEGPVEDTPTICPKCSIIQYDSSLTTPGDA